MGILMISGKHSPDLEAKDGLDSESLCSLLERAKE